MKNKLHEFILTFFLVGYVTSFPGTLASFVTLIICFFIPSKIYFILSFIVLILAFYSCYLFSKNSDLEDPSFIVIDEVIGMMISLLFIQKNLILYIVAFLLFRFFDIMKPSIINHSQNLKYGIGIVMDDIIAALFVILIMYNIYL